MSNESYFIHGKLGVDFDCIYVTAIHEAGHTALALLCNGKVAFTSIKEATINNLLGITSWTSTTRTCRDCKYITHLGGIAAQQLFEDPEVRNLGPDTDRKQTKEAMWVDRNEEQNVDRFEVDAIKLLRKHWKLVERIAHSLLAAPRGVLGRAEILEIFNSYTADVK